MKEYKLKPLAMRTMRKSFAEILHNLSLSENGNRHNQDDLPTHARGYYHGILWTVMAGIMGFAGTSWYRALCVLKALLPSDHISLRDVNATWDEYTDEEGRIDVSKFEQYL